MSKKADWLGGFTHKQALCSFSTQWTKLVSVAKITADTNFKLKISFTKSV